MEKALKQFYSKNKAYLLPSFIIFAAIFILFAVLLPQLGALQETRDKINQEEKEIRQLQSAFTTIRDFDPNELSNNLSLLSSALPDRKNIVGIFLGLSSAGSASGVRIDGVSFKPGIIIGKEGNISSSKNAPSLLVDIRVSANDMESIRSFIKELYKSFPISEIESVNINESGGSFKINFYYKPYNLSALKSPATIKPLTPSDQKVLENLRTWK
jgi:hypothetical protein